MNYLFVKWLGKCAFLVSLVVFAGSTVADDRIFAVIDDVDFKNGQVVLDDRLFKLALDVKIVDEAGKKTTIYALTRGTPVYFFAEGRQVRSVELLPKGTPRPVVDDDE